MHASTSSRVSGALPTPAPSRRRRAPTGLLAALALLGLTAIPGCTTKPPAKVADPAQADEVIVHKSERRLELRNNGQTFRQYRVALGGAPRGHKVREGDQRTPEGEYVLNWRKPNSNFYKAIHISYPNRRDQMISQQLGHDPGGMIMLHGLPNYIQSERLRQEYASRDWTQGCIAVQNHEMDEIWNLVPVGTPIRILP